MIRLRKDDFQDPHDLAKLAATAGLSNDEFRKEFDTSSRTIRRRRTGRTARNSIIS